jgi:benzylsuccinate CoA-transferase BbsF subunit
VPSYAVLRPTDLHEDPQLRHRGFFVTLDHPVMGPTPYDGPATLFSRTPARLRSPAPLLGQHSDAVRRMLEGVQAG